MNIVFNVNTSGMEGLGATITSMLRNCSNDARLKIYVLCSRLSLTDKNNISELLSTENFSGEFVFIDYNADNVFSSLRGFNGDYTTYGKLLISRMVEEDVVLYLDSDLIVNLDVLELESFDFQGKAIAAVFGSKVKHVLDRSFLIEKQHWHEDIAYFNAGIILFNLSQWRQDYMDKKWEALTQAYPSDFISHDQTILNALSKGNFVRLPAKFNVAWKPGKELLKTDDRIVHFVGSPKPWDIMGSELHLGHKLWSAYDSANWKRIYCGTSLRRIRRAWKIRRSILQLYPAVFTRKFALRFRNSTTT